jgi:hypothetical protein
MADWDVMTNAATVVKAARSQVDIALSKIDRIKSAPSRWVDKHPIPAAQKSRVEEWREALSGALAILDELDVDAWKPEVIASQEGAQS